MEQCIINVGGRATLIYNVKQLTEPVVLSLQHEGNSSSSKNSNSSNITCHPIKYKNTMFGVWRLSKKVRK